jgi:hypothetical protein
MRSRRVRERAVQLEQESDVLPPMAVMVFVMEGFE